MRRMPKPLLMLKALSVSRSTWVTFGVVLPLALSLALARPARAASPADQVVHTVQPGENLYRIGLRYGVAWTAIMQANGLASPYVYAGQQLVIPTGGATAINFSAPASASATTYVVRSGDTLFSIARRFGLTSGALASANGLSDPSRIYVGQALRIPGVGPPGAGGAGVWGSASGKRIVIDLSDQRLYAYQGDAPVFNFIASTGAPGMNTAVGQYSVLNKIPNAYGSTWDIWMPNWLGIYWAGSLQNGIHALPILPGGGRMWAGYLGTPVSYGCIVLGIAEAQQLYDWAEVGVPVTIRY